MIGTFLVLLGTAFPAWATDAANIIHIPAGVFKPFWLSPKTKGRPQRENLPGVTIAAFDIFERQVTVSEFKNFLENQPEWKKENVSSLFSDGAYLQNQNDPNTSELSPVTSVSWFAAKAYCQSLKMRLPTTDEWEYIAAASENKKDASTEGPFLQRILDWYGEPSDKPIGKTKSIYKNVYGVWDLHGLVWEWVSDFNSSFVTGESREDSSLNKDLFCGAGNISGGNKENYAAFMRFAFRSSLKGSASVRNLGFRCARSQ